ncbi:MAG: small ribosomal subunit Rsm22 family protein [Haloferacaceae archaeon]
MIDREAVRSNAKYLRQVRPIDPAEISEYVEGRPHPGVVKQVLQEEAYDLGLFEREDGTFVPAEEGPIPDPRWHPTAFPEEWAFAVEDFLVSRYGANWHRGDSGDRLREAIRRLKADYYYENPVEYDADAAAGYAVYHLPDYYATVGYVLDDLVENGLLDHRLRVLDVGAGVGGPALGLHDYLPEAATVDYHAVEPSAAAAVLEHLLGSTRRNFRTTIHESTAEAFDPTDVAESFDLILFANVLSELDDPAAVVERYLEAVAEDGSLVAVAPADLNTSTGLRTVERAVAPPDGDVTVYSPTLRLWPGEAPSDRGWSFDRRDDVAAPAFQTRLAEASNDLDAFLNESVQFSHAILRTDGRRRYDVRADSGRFAKMAEMERHVTNRIDLLAVKLSRNLSEGGNPLFKVGDGSEAVENYAVLTRESALNSDLLAAEYGAVLAFENALALWNDDEGAYNLVVDGETVVDLVAGELRP